MTKKPKYPKLTPHERAKKAAAASPWKRKPACDTPRAHRIFKQTNQRDSNGSPETDPDLPT